MGAVAAPAIANDLVELLEQRAGAARDALAFTFLLDGEREGRDLTYGSLHERAVAIAGALRATAPRGARIVLLYPPGLDYIEAFFGCLYGGFVAVPAYPPDPTRLSRSLPRLRAIVEDARADVVSTTSEIADMASSLSALAPSLAALRWIATDRVDARGAPPPERGDVGADTLALIQYTSGSTGTPKGVMLTHGNLMANERMIREVFGLSKRSVGVGWLPMYHDMGLIGNVIQTVYSGFRCVLMSPLDFLRRPARWLEAISRYGGTASGGPNFAYDLCVRKVAPEERARLDLRSWTLAFSGAEPVRAETLDAFARVFAPCGFERRAFLPCFGLAEASLLVAGKVTGGDYHVADLDARSLEEGRASPAAAPSPARQVVGAGRAVAGTTVLVVDPATREVCSDGRIGEIWVAGPHVAAGYWNDPDASARTFVAAPSGAADGARFLRTGDLGFLLDGEVFVSGRLKDLIIVRGRNHHPHDIERYAEAAHPRLRRGCAAAFSIDEGGEERVVVAVELDRRPLSGEAAADPREVILAVRRAVADGCDLQVHAVVLLEAGTIPKTSSGKIQRHACRAAFLDGSLDVVARGDDEGAPALPAVSIADLRGAPRERRAALVERYLRAALARTARAAEVEVDLDAPLASLVHDSLAAVELAHAIERDLGAVVPLTTFLRDGSARDLVERIATEGAPERPHAPARDGARPPPGDVGGEAFALSPGQEALWFLQQLAPASSAYHLHVALAIDGEVAPAALEAALRAIAARHEVLHTTYSVVDGRPVQRPRPQLAAELALEAVDASTWSDAELDDWLVSASRRPFDLEAGPVLRAALASRSATASTLFVGVHHVAADLRSLEILVRELPIAYAGARAGRPPLALAPPSRARYRDFVDWQRSYASAQGESDWRYWRAELAGAQPLELPTDLPRPAVQTYEGAAHRATIDRALMARVEELARAERVTVYVVLLAAYQVLLSRYTGQRSFFVGSPSTERPGAPFRDVVGYFVNPLPIRAHLGGDPTARALVRRVRATMLDALEHRHFPLPTAVKRLALAPDPSRSPIFQALFAFEKAQADDDAAAAGIVLGAENGELTFEGLTLRHQPVRHTSAQFDLALSVSPTSAGAVVRWEYNTALFGAATIARMAAHFEALLGAIVRDPEVRASRLPLVTPAERDAILGAWNRTATAYARDRAVPERIAAQIERRPDAPAVTFEGRTATYRALGDAANRIAAAVARAGAGPDDLVAVVMERSFELVAALLGVMQSGAVYVPIDPTYPSERVATMLEDAGARVLVTQPRLRAALPPFAGAIVDADAVIHAPAEGARPARALPLESGAYMIYTSGSTGQPKGVINTHGGLLNRLAWMAEGWGLREDDVVLHKTPFGFDVSVWELFAPLVVGARLVVARPGGHMDPSYLCDRIAAEGVTVAHFIPSMLQATIDEPALARCASLRRVVCSGEALPASLAAAFFERSGAELYNLYGPTEAAIEVSAWRCVRGAADATVPIGAPIANTQLYVLDDAMDLAPVGVPGELYIGGVQIARGYFRRPDLTAERFVPNPYGPGRLYRTGDAAKWREGGTIEYLGRLDHQVKIRGFRIELGEIEAALRGEPGVREAVAAVHRAPSEGALLVAYVVGDAPFDALRDRLRARLPEYMVPARFVRLDALPLSPNGKLDRRALPAPAAAVAPRDVAPPTTAPQDAMCRIAAELLGVDRVGIHDNFFELGGHSLLAMQFVARVRAALRVDMSVRTLFENPTVSRLEAVILHGATEEGEL